MKEVRYLNKFKDKGHYCDNLVLNCMDFRFHEALESHLELFFKYKVFTYDSRGSVGGSFSIIDKENRDTVFEAIDLAVEKHKVERVIIVDHIDCGGYGGSTKHENETKEREFHVAKLCEAYSIIKERYSDLDVVLLYQDWDTICEVTPKEA